VAHRRRDTALCYSAATDKTTFEESSSRRRHPSVFIAAVYGGYFGAGLGIVLLAVMALTLPYDIYEIQGIRSVLGMLINAVAAVVFIVRGHLDLNAVYALLLGSLIGGWLGTLLIRRVTPKVVRTLVIIVGTGTTIRLAIGS
jgi:uncharacterized membrane protein YfcA